LLSPKPSHKAELEPLIVQ